MANASAPILSIRGNVVSDGEYCGGQYRLSFTGKPRQVPRSFGYVRSGTHATRFTGPREGKEKKRVGAPALAAVVAMRKFKRSRPYTNSGRWTDGERQP